jgi:ABC-type uncharacterized transport system ATPase subunit
MTVRLENICKRFGDVRANDGITMSLAPGTIHGLLGENGAGKSTLARILSGFLRPDEGHILIDDDLVTFSSPRRAVDLGIGMLHQDPLDVPAFSVLDNFLLGAPHEAGHDRRASRQALAELAGRFGFDLDPSAPLASLSVGERQQLEMVRLLRLGVRVLILDEPTTAISASQRRSLFDTLRALAAEGRIVLFVSHKLEEVQGLCDEVTVLARGKVTGRLERPLPTEDLVRMMFGHTVASEPHEASVIGVPLLEVEGLMVSDWRLVVERLSLSVRAGEVIGLAGLEGSGQRLLLHACCGLAAIDDGHIRLAGRDMTGRPYQDYLVEGVQYVPAARLEEGLVAGMTMTEHVALGESRDRFLVDWPAMTRRTSQLVRDFGIAGGPDTRAGALSGGNQQRLLLALLPADVKLLLMEHPTRGLDLESSEDIWRRLSARARQGTAILFASADLDELLQRSDRLLVFFGGRVSILDARGADHERLGILIGGKSVE